MLKKSDRIQAPITYKSFAGLDFKAPSTDSRKVSGYFASFDTIDSDMDIIRKGAFAKSISERGPGSASNRQIKYLHQHNITEIAGPLVRLFEDEKGLGFEAEIERTPLGDIILERYLNGTYKEHSIGFRYVWDKCSFIQMNIEGQDATVDVLECKELNLFEGSVVTFGANSNTPFTGQKGMTKEDCFKQLSDELEYLLRKGAITFETEMQIRSLWAKQISLEDSLADEITKEKLKADADPKGFDFKYLANNINF